MAEEKNGKHEFCLKDFEPDTERHKAAAESAATILAKGGAHASQAEKDNLKALW